MASVTGALRARTRVVGGGPRDMARGFPGRMHGSSFQEPQEAGNDEPGQEGTEVDVRSPVRPAR